MAAHDPSLLPVAPPPRPSGREAAIGAAMRRLDGLPDAPAAAAPARAGFGRRPHAAAWVTASLIVAVGFPAMLIAIRDNQPRPATEAEAPAAVRSKARAADSARSPTIAAPEELQSEVAVPAPPANLPTPHRRSALSDGAPADAATPAPLAEYAPPPAPAAAAPPPPATAKAQEEAVETENASADQQIVVTGSRVEAPRSVAARPFEPLSVSGPRSAAENVRGVLADPAYRTFFAQLQGAVRSNNRQMVVALARMPLRVNFNGRSQTYRDTKTLVADYERVFTPKVRRAILAQRYESLFTRDQGLMIGSGEVWFDRVCRDRNCVRGPVRIIAVNP